MNGPGVSADARMQELPWALECASRIFKEKKNISSRQAGALLAAERKAAHLEHQLAEAKSALGEILREQYRIEPMSSDPRPAALADRISVIIPVKNGGDTLPELLRKIRAQRKVEDVEIIVIDSGSTDGSVAVAESFGCRVIRIPQKDFNHGGTRNLGAREARGDFLVFTVQDAVPVGNYWLYGMVCPFLSHPDLGAVSSRQFVRPDADLYSQWTNEETNRMIGFEGDSVYGLSPSFDFTNWKHLDGLTKRRLSFLDDVSSCVPKSVFHEVPFSPLNNAEDMDLGIRLLEKGRKIGFLTSTGVYHWHDRGPDYVLKRHYIGTKANLYILRSSLPRFFEVQDIGWKAFVANVADMLDLLAAALPGAGGVDPKPLNASRAFVSSIRRYIDASPGETSAAFGEPGRSAGDRLESLCPGVFGAPVFLPGERHQFHRNFLVSHFLRGVGQFAEFLGARQSSLKGREEEFLSALHKILAAAVGEALGAYFLEAETRGRLTGDLTGMDRLLAKGVCSF